MAAISRKPSVVSPLCRERLSGPSVASYTTQSRAEGIRITRPQGSRSSRARARTDACMWACVFESARLRAHASSCWPLSRPHEREGGLAPRVDNVRRAVDRVPLAHGRLDDRHRQGRRDEPHYPLEERVRRPVGFAEGKRRRQEEHSGDVRGGPRLRAQPYRESATRAAARKADHRAALTVVKVGKGADG